MVEIYNITPPLRKTQCNELKIKENTSRVLNPLFVLGAVQCWDWNRVFRRLAYVVRRRWMSHSVSPSWASLLYTTLGSLPCILSSIGQSLASAGDGCCPVTCRYRARQVGDDGSESYGHSRIPCPKRPQFVHHTPRSGPPLTWTLVDSDKG